MSRLVYALVGFALFLLAIFILWMTSQDGHLTLARMGIPVDFVRPSQVQVPFMTLFILSYVLVAGTFMERFTSMVKSTLSGGFTGMSQKLQQPVRRGSSAAWPLVWGILAYVATSLLVGVFLLLFGSSTEKSLMRLLDLEMIRVIFLWPWHLLAAAGAFGFSSAEYYPA